MRRRDFISLLSSAATSWPLAALAQQSALLVVGFLSFRSEADATDSVVAFRRGLGEVGYVEGRNVAVEYRWADAHLDRLSTLAEELVSRPDGAVLAVLIDELPRVLIPTSAPMPTNGYDEQDCCQHYQNGHGHDAMPPKHQCGTLLSSALWENRR